MKLVVDRIIRDAKADEYCKMYGGFAVVKLSNGTVDYFPAGQTPNIAGQPDRAAEYIGKWRWNHRRWSRIA